MARAEESPLFFDGCPPPVKSNIMTVKHRHAGHKSRVMVSQKKISSQTREESSLSFLEPLLDLGADVAGDTILNSRL